MCVTFRLKHVLHIYVLHANIAAHNRCGLVIFRAPASVQGGLKRSRFWQLSLLKMMELSDKKI